MISFPQVSVTLVPTTPLFDPFKVMKWGKILHPYEVEQEERSKHVLRDSCRANDY